MPTHEKQLFFLSTGLHACICSQLNAQATLLPCYDPQKQQSSGSPSQSWNVSFSLLASKRPGSRDPLGGEPARKAKHLHLFIFLLHFVPKGTGVSYKNTHNGIFKN